MIFLLIPWSWSTDFLDNHRIMIKWFLDDYLVMSKWLFDYRHLTMIKWFLDDYPVIINWLFDYHYLMMIVLWLSDENQMVVWQHGGMIRKVKTVTHAHFSRKYKLVSETMFTLLVWILSSKMVKMVQKGPKWSKITKNGLKWS